MISNRLSVRTFRWSASLLSKKAETSKNASTTKKTQKDAIEKSTEEKPKKTVKSKKKVTEEKEKETVEKPKKKTVAKKKKADIEQSIEITADLPVKKSRAKKKAAEETGEVKPKKTTAKKKKDEKATSEKSEETKAPKKKAKTSTKKATKASKEALEEMKQKPVERVLPVTLKYYFSLYPFKTQDLSDYWYPTESKFKKVVQEDKSDAIVPEETKMRVLPVMPKYYFSLYPFKTEDLSAYPNHDPTDTKYFEMLSLKLKEAELEKVKAVVEEIKEIEKGKMAQVEQAEPSPTLKSEQNVNMTDAAASETVSKPEMPSETVKVDKVENVTKTDGTNESANEVKTSEVESKPQKSEPSKISEPESKVTENVKATDDVANDESTKTSEAVNVEAVPLEERSGFVQEMHKPKNDDNEGSIFNALKNWWNKFKLPK